MPAFESTDEAVARRLDAEDPLRGFRDRFHVPAGPDGSPRIYFVGNSLGLQPKGVRSAVDAELDGWARMGVRGHFEGTHPWYAYPARLAHGMNKRHLTLFFGLFLLVVSIRMLMRTLQA